MARWLIFCVGILGISAMVKQDPKKVVFSTLMNLSFKEVYNADKEKWEYQPSFPQEVLDLNGKEVFIKGYVIPVDLTGDVYALSAYPFSSCFFCGGAGPESVLGLTLKEPKRYNTDDIVTFTGVMKISTQYESEFFYTLENAWEYQP